jgi:hypothetical protein
MGLGLGVGCCDARADSHKVEGLGFSVMGLGFRVGCCDARADSFKVIGQVLLACHTLIGDGCRNRIDSSLQQSVPLARIFQGLYLPLQPLISVWDGGSGAENPMLASAKER